MRIISLLKFIYPQRLRYSICFHFIVNRMKKYPVLFKDAPLALAPLIKMDLKPGDFIHNWIALLGIYEPYVTKEIKFCSKKEGLMVDVGANFGYYTCLWCGLNPLNRAIAFEPSKKVFACLKTNIKKNQLSKRVIIEQYALGNKGGLHSFSYESTEQTGWGRIAKNSANGNTLIKMTKLDDYCKTHSIKNIDILKIDTQGYDYFVLKGAQKMLKTKQIRKVFFEEDAECNKEFNLKPDASYKLMESLGYKIKKLDKWNYLAELSEI